MLRLDKVGKTYRTTDLETAALSGVTLEVAQGEFLAIMGPSGSGKSTLLGIIGLLDGASSGSYTFLGEDVSKGNDSLLTKLRRQHVGFIFQAFNLIPHLTIEANIDIGLAYRGVKGSERRERSIAALRDVGLEARARHYPSQLSGGQQQRAAIARAVVGGPSLILADEPTGNLDSGNGRRIMEMLEGISARGTTVVMVTHSEEQARRAHRVVSMRDGQLH